MPVMRSTQIFLLAIMVSATLVQAKPVWACSCVFPPTPADAFRQWEAVFQGTVVGYADSRPLPLVDQFRDWLGLPNVYNYGSRMFSIEVIRSWKGVTTTRADVRTGSGGADCGYEFVLGLEYVVYASYTADGDWGTSICTRTNPTASAVDDLTYLGPLPTLVLTATHTPFNWLWVCVGLLVVLTALALATLWMVRRQRPRLPNL